MVFSRSSYVLTFLVTFILQAASQSLTIDGLWTQDRPPYGTDTLIIKNGELYESFVLHVGGSTRRIFAKIIESPINPGKLKYQVFKVIQGGVHFLHFGRRTLSEGVLRTTLNSQ